MNRVLEWNEVEGWIRIQPGVTQGQVVEFLAKKNSRFQFDQTYWLSTSSVIGNSLERGRTLVSERERDLIGTRTVLASGEIIRTGFDPRAKSPIGSGLNLHSLIFQSNLGVVVEGIVRLHPKPSSRKYFLLSFRSFEEFVRIFFQTQVRYEGAMRPLRWFCSESIAAAPVRLRARGSGGVLAIEADESMTLNRIRDVFKGAAVHSISRDQIMSTMEHMGSIASASFAFFSCSIRRTAQAFGDLHRFVAKLEKRFSMRFFVTVSFINSTSTVFVIRVEADPSQDSDAVRRWIQRVAASIEDHGYIPYRNHSGLRARSSEDFAVRQKIKKCFDPNGIIAPGRYGL